MDRDPSPISWQPARGAVIGPGLFALICAGGGALAYLAFALARFAFLKFGMLS